MQKEWEGGKQKLQLGFEEASLIMMLRTIYYSDLKI